MVRVAASLRVSRPGGRRGLGRSDCRSCKGATARRTRTLALPPLVLSLALAGCMVGPDFKSADAPIAQQWLDANQPGTTARSPDPFYGYYTVDFEKDGRLVGMLSVSGSSGAVWYHSWHGSFVQVRDLGA